MSLSLHLGLDVGGTASRYVLCDGQGQEIARGRASGATGHVFNPAEKDKLRAALKAIAAEIAPRQVAIASVTLGLTGYGPAVSGEVTGLVSEAFGVASGRVIAFDDIILAYMANFAPGEGHLISAGTGSIGVHIGVDGAFTRVGGRGILIDDGGSGSWIALTALDRIYRVLDQDGDFGSVSLLAEHLLQQVGGNDWSDVRQFVYAGDRGRIGTLAVGVAKAATAGDAAAEAILRQAGVELARLAQALVKRVGPRPIGFIGGVLALHPAISDEIHAALGDGDVRLLSADASLAAARLQAGGNEAWLTILMAQRPG